MKEISPAGLGASFVAQAQCGRPIKSVLEIGAGSADVTMGLVTQFGAARFLITDPNEAALERLRADLTDDRCEFATLAYEDLGKLDGGGFDLIVATSVLQAIGDWRGFLADAAGKLAPGGLLMMQLPFREGGLFMAVALDIVLSPLWPANAPIDPADRARLKAARDSIYAEANPKQGTGQSFVADEIFNTARQLGYDETILYRNSHFLCLADNGVSRLSGYFSLFDYMESFLIHHYKVSPNTVSVMYDHLRSLLRGLESTFNNFNGPPLLGVVTLKKPADALPMAASRPAPALDALYDKIRNSDFNRWVGLADPRHVGECSARALMRCFPSLEGMKILDYGCGVGRVSTAILAKMGGKGQLVGVDIIPKLVEFCRDNITPIFPNASFHCTEVSNGHYDQFRGESAVPNLSVEEFRRRFAGFFDVVCAFSVLTHQTPEGTRECLKTLFEAVKPGGHAFITCILINDFSAHQADNDKIKWPFFDKEKFKNTKDVFYALPHDELNIVAHNMDFFIKTLTSVGFLPERIQFGGWAGGVPTDFEQEVFLCQRPA